MASEHFVLEFFFFFFVIHYKAYFYVTLFETPVEIVANCTRPRTPFPTRDDRERTRARNTSSFKKKKKRVLRDPHAFARVIYVRDRIMGFESRPTYITMAPSSRPRRKRMSIPRVSTAPPHGFRDIPVVRLINSHTVCAVDVPRVFRGRRHGTFPIDGQMQSRHDGAAADASSRATVRGHDDDGGGCGVVLRARRRLAEDEPTPRRPGDTTTRRSERVRWFFFFLSNSSKTIDGKHGRGDVRRYRTRLPCFLKRFTRLYGKLYGRAATRVGNSSADEIYACRTRAQWLDYYGEWVKRGRFTPPSTLLKCLHTY